MRTTQVINCTICQEAMPSEGTISWVNQLIPSRHVKKLENCVHSVHSSCFQDYVNRNLATNYDHHGPIECPLCKKTVEAIHSLNILMTKYQAPFFLGYGVSAFTCALYGLGFMTIVMGNEGATRSRKILKAVVGLVIMVVGKLFSSYYDKNYNNDLMKTAEFLGYIYNLRFGTNLQRKDVLFGMNHPSTLQQILINYRFLIQFIGLLQKTDRMDDEGKEIYSVFKTTVKNPDSFVKSMKEAVLKHSNIPNILEDAKEHFWQIVIDEQKQDALLGFLTSIALEEKLLNIPDNVECSPSIFYYGNLKYEHIN